jgi:hypothetical protein
VAYEGLQYPVNASPQGLYSWAGNHVTQLRRILEEAAQAGSDLTALQAQITTLTTGVDDLDNRVTVLESAGGSGLSAQTAWEISLATQVRTILGSPAEFAHHVQTQQEIDAEAAMSAALIAHRGLTGIFQEQTLRVSEDESLAQDIKVLTADLGVANALIADVQTAVSDGDNALASRLTVAETNVAGNTASIASQQTSIDGIYASSTITLSLQGRVIGTQTLSGTPLGSVFAVDADYFSVGNPTYPNKPVFAISTINGVAGVAFHGNMYADGTIIARHIQAGTITADKLSVMSLSAITANIGTATAGLIKDVANTYNFDVANGIIKRVDNTMKIDFNSKFFEIVF